MYYLTIGSEIAWIVIACVGVAITMWALREAVRDQRAVLEAGINGSATKYTHEHVNQEIRSVIACSIALAGGVIRFYIPNQFENIPRTVEMWTATSIVIVVIGLLSVASVRRLQLRSATLAVFKNEHSDTMLSRSALMDAIWTTTALIIVDMKTGVILQATRPAEQLFGYHMVGDIRGRSIEDLVPEHLRAQHKKHRSRFADHPEARPMGTAGMVLLGRKRDGKVFPVEIGLCAAIIEGRECVIASVADASARQVGQEHGDRH